MIIRGQETKNRGEAFGTKDTVRFRQGGNPKNSFLAGKTFLRSRSSRTKRKEGKTPIAPSRESFFKRTKTGSLMMKKGSEEWGKN